MSSQETSEGELQKPYRILAAAEIQNFFDSQPSVFLEGQNPKIFAARKRMVEIFAGHAGLVQVGLETPEMISKNIKKNPSPLLLSRQNRDEFGPLLKIEPGLLNTIIPSNDISLTLIPPNPDNSGDRALIGINGQLLGHKVISQENHGEFFIGALIEATGLSLSEVEGFAGQIFELRKTSARQEVIDDDEELVSQAELVGEESYAPTGRQFDSQRTATNLRFGLEESGNVELYSGEMALRPDQQEVLEAIAEGIGSGLARMGVFAATATGKTYMMQEFVRMGQLPTTLVIVPTQVALRQTVKRFRETSMSVGAYYAYAKDTFASLDGNGPKVIVTTYDSFIRDDFAIEPQHVSAIMYDEAHELLGRAKFERMQQFSHKANGLLEILWTGSPDLDMQGIRSLRRIAPAVFNRGPLEYAEEGIIAPFRVWLARTKMDLSNVPVNVATGEYDEETVRRKSEELHLGEQAALIYLNYFSTESRKQGCIVFCAGITHAKNVAADFEKFGIKVAYISGQTPPTEQEEILRAYTAGEIEVLCNADLLTQAVDLPRTKAILSLSPTFSLRVVLQRAGRGFRPYEEEGLTLLEFIPQSYGSKSPPLSFAVAVGAPKGGNQEGEYIPPKQGSTRRTAQSSDRGAPTPPLPELTVGLMTDLEEVMRVGVALYNANTQVNRLEEAPDRWMSSYDVIEELQRRTGEKSQRAHLIDIYVKDYKKQFPEESNENIHTYIGRGGKSTASLGTFYSPELSVKIIDYIIAETVRPPENWVSVSHTVQRIMGETAREGKKGVNRRDLVTKLYIEYQELYPPVEGQPAQYGMYRHPKTGVKILYASAEVEDEIVALATRSDVSKSGGRQRAEANRTFAEAYIAVHGTYWDSSETRIEIKEDPKITWEANDRAIINRIVEYILKREAGAEVNGKRRERASYELGGIPQREIAEDLKLSKNIVGRAINKHRSEIMYHGRKGLPGTDNSTVAQHVDEFAQTRMREIIDEFIRNSKKISRVNIAGRINAEAILYFPKHVTEKGYILSYAIERAWQNLQSQLI